MKRWKLLENNNVVTHFHYRLESELESYRNTIADKNAEIKLLNEHVAVLKNSEEQHISKSKTLEEENKSAKELKESLEKQMKKNDVSILKKFFFSFISILP